MNLAALAHLESEATPGPWTRLPVLFTPRGAAVMMGANEPLVLALRNVAPEMIEVVARVQDQARAYIQAAKAGTAVNVAEYGAACIETLRANDALICRMETL